MLHLPLIQNSHMLACIPQFYQNEDFCVEQDWLIPLRVCQLRFCFYFNLYVYIVMAPTDPEWSLKHLNIVFLRAESKVEWRKLYYLERRPQPHSNSINNPNNAAIYSSVGILQSQHLLMSPTTTSSPSSMGCFNFSKSSYQSSPVHTFVKMEEHNFFSTADVGKPFDVEDNVAADTFENDGGSSLVLLLRLVAMALLFRHLLRVGNFFG
ncbi:putative transcription factor [Corchorus olitorius]|uniref:Transcription factor n=1 Tax=Corchorus olitorius TaxID=93759 RepID=A0A1R3KQ85_9ROSI|nr:putative transcription factor [Corchorus olitorius]